MTVNLRPHSTLQPLEIEEAQFEELVRRATGGWSRCADETEWLAKLYYLRSGFEAEKLDRATFEERETRLVVIWLRNVAS